MSFLSTTHFFFRCAGPTDVWRSERRDPFDCGVREALENYAGAELLRLVVLVP